MTTNLVNGKRYIGRKTATKFLGNEYLGSGRQFRNAVEKYGKENFSVEMLDECITRTQLIIHEYLFIKAYNAVEDEMFYNHSPGGLHEGWVAGEGNIAKTDYARKINSEKHKGITYSKETTDKRTKTYLENHDGSYDDMIREREKTCLKVYGVDCYSKTDEFREAQSKRSTEYNLTKKDYKQLSEDAKGKKMMYKDGEQTWVYLPKQEQYLKNGWQFGSCKKRKKKRKKNISSE